MIRRSKGEFVCECNDCGERCFGGVEEDFRTFVETLRKQAGSCARMATSGNTSVQNVRSETMSEPVELPPVHCDTGKCIWKDSYYGYQCIICGLLIPYGCEPWAHYEDDSDDDGYQDD